MGPLANPASVRRQLVGIARACLCADLCRGDPPPWRLRPSLVVSGDEGLDELSLAGGRAKPQK